MDEVIFLLVLGLIYVIFASIQDLKKREVANWLSFSLIVFALGFRFFYSLFSESGFNFFYQGLIGLGFFLVIGNLFYYGRMFAGGDAKLMIALGTILPFTDSFFMNLNIFVLFFLSFLFSGAFYGFIWTITLSLRNHTRFKKEFCKRFSKTKKFTYLFMILGLIFMGIGFFKEFFFLIGIFIFMFPYLYLFAKSVDESFMIKNLKTNALTEGDWLYKDVKVGKKIIKANWEGLSSREISLIQNKHKSVFIRQGIPFVPVFLIAYLILLLFWFTGLWNSLW